MRLLPLSDDGIAASFTRRSCPLGVPRRSCTSMLVGQRNGGGEHSVRIETTLQGSQPSAVAAVGIPGLFSIMWR